MIKISLIVVLLITQPVMASPLSDSALRMIKIGNEIGAPIVVKNGQDLLLKGMFKFNDFDAIYEASKQARLGNQLMGYPPQIHIANQLLSKLLKQGYEPAIYDSALFLLDGESGFVKDEFMALSLLEDLTGVYSNAQAAFLAAAVRNELLIRDAQGKRRINELIDFAILNNVSGATQYQKYHIGNEYTHNPKVKSWRNWVTEQR